MSNSANNPLLNLSGLPQFDAFHVEHIEPAIDQLLEQNLSAVEAIVDSGDQPTWENFVEPLEVLSNRMERVWGPIGHLDAVKNSDEWHQAYNQCLEKVTNYHTQLGQNQGLFEKFQAIAESAAFNEFSLAQKKVVEDALRDFHLSGIDLPPQKQQEFKQLSQQLWQLTSTFGNNVLKGSQAWSKLITNETELAGLPESAMGLLKQLAEQKGESGWLVTLDVPAYLAVMTHADNRDLRAEIYEAYAVRASEIAQHSEFDNSENIKQILALRHQKAQLLGYQHYGELSLATKMADTSEQVVGVIREGAVKSKQQAQTELETLQAYANENLPGLGDLQPWDVSYASEKYKNATLSLW